MYFDTVAAKQLDYYVNRPGVLIVDLRSRDEYRKGHVKSAVNIPYDGLRNQDSYLMNYNTIVFYCERGNMSLLAARQYCNYPMHIINIYGGLHAYRGELVYDRE
ncbi:rhodanese-like domain protein [Lachnospiraceae bacterium KM106-2]|nr:rhodanese-like domain protein [Lachnospiraceae bacterium KM106-2]